MEKNDHRDIWVFLEEFEGKPKQVGAELLGQARRLADEIGQEVAAVIIAHDADEALEMARRYGADRAYVIEGECYRHFTADPYAEAFSYLCEKYQPEIILVGATANGRELASHVAVKLEAGLTADCTALYIDPVPHSAVISMRVSVRIRIHKWERCVRGQCRCPSQLPIRI